MGSHTGSVGTPLRMVLFRLLPFSLHLLWCAATGYSRKLQKWLPVSCSHVAFHKVHNSTCPMVLCSSSYWVHLYLIAQPEGVSGYSFTPKSGHVKQGSHLGGVPCLLQRKFWHAIVCRQVPWELLQQRPFHLLLRRNFTKVNSVLHCSTRIFPLSSTTDWLTRSFAGLTWIPRCRQCRRR